jgi:hypothetical protein
VALTLTDAVLGSARVVRDLALSQPVRDRWDEESACAGMSIGGLAHHLAGQATALVRLLPEEPDDGDLIPVREHYRRAAWANSGPDDEANVSIREGADEQATGGYDALADRLDGDLAALPSALGQATDDRPVLIPWQGWSLTAHDLAVTRLMEMVVHADDLAASIDRPTPDFPDEAVRVVLELLSQVALDRHGQAALVRALSRPQRAPASVSAF